MTTPRTIVKVVNPNTTESMTRMIEASARGAAGPGTGILAITSAMGPASIESHYDEALSVPGLLAEITGGEAADGYVIACSETRGSTPRGRWPPDPSSASPRRRCVRRHISAARSAS